MSDNDSNTSFCCGIFSEYKYDQAGLEYIMDDYGGDVILIDKNDNNNAECVEFPSSKRNSLVAGCYSVTMVSKNSDISLLMTFKNTNKGRILISGQMIKDRQLFTICEYNVLENKETDNSAFAKCFYKSA